MIDRVLVICAHPDDEVIGCGGTIARHVADGDEVHVIYVADGETARIQAAKPNRNLAAFHACKALGVASHVFLDQKDQKLDMQPLLNIIQMIEPHVERIKPTIVYTHHAGDLNKDHRIVHEATITACRPLPGSTVREIYAFEVLSSSEWGSAFAPNHFVGVLLGGALDKKMRALRFYGDEMRMHPHPRSYETVERLAYMRGTQCGLCCAEAFVTMRSVR